MKIKLNYYGKITDITQKSFEIIDVEQMTVRSIKNSLGKIYSELQNMTYQLAENNTILKEENPVQTTELDVFPPFSGG